MVEQHSIIPLEGSKAQVIFKVAGEDTAAEYRKVVSQYSREIEMKGFRKGKAPVELLERKFGKEFRGQAFQEILEQCWKEVAPEIEPKPYGNPYFCDETGEVLEGEPPELKPGETLEFTVAFDTVPTVPLPTLDGLDWQGVSLELGAEDLDQEIDKYRQQAAIMVERKDETGVDGDIYSLRFALAGEGEEPAEEAKLRTIVRLGEADPHGFHDVVREMKGGEVRQLRNFSFPEEDMVEEELRGKTADVWLELTSIRTRELPDMDDDFAQDIDENFETLDDLKQHIREKLEKDSQELREQYALLRIYRHWFDTLDFAIPQTMVEEETRAVLADLRQRTGGSEQHLLMHLGMYYGGDVQSGLHTLEKEALQGLFVRLVRQQLLDSKGWEAGEEELDAELNKMAATQDISVEKLREQYADRWEQIKQLAARQVLSARLNQGLLAEAGAGNTQGSELRLSLAELKDRWEQDNAAFRDAVYEKFSPFKDTGGMLSAGEPA
ncbi:MAG: trigger factor [Spirochaetota bacterium]